MTTVHLVQRCLTPLAILLFAVPLAAAQDQVRILQSNAAGDRVHIIDPVTNEVVGEILDIERAHGVTASPDGSRIYVANEADDTLDVADFETLKVIKKIPLSGRPNNLAISPDGRRVYVGIMEAVGQDRAWRMSLTLRLSPMSRASGRKGPSTTCMSPPTASTWWPATPEMGG